MNATRQVYKAAPVSASITVPINKHRQDALGQQEWEGGGGGWKGRVILITGLFLYHDRALSRDYRESIPRGERAIHRRVSSNALSKPRRR